MSFIPTSQKIAQVNNTLSKHEEELKSQKNITLFFTVIVGITLVATLTGLFGLYINSISKYNYQEKPSQDNLYNLTNNYINSQENSIRDLSGQINQLKTDLLILKVKNPSLK